MYVDGFVLAIKKDKVEDYKRIAEKAGKVWMQHGAVAYYECIGDDLHPDTEGHTIRNFDEVSKASEDEVPFFSFIIFESKEARDEINAKVMADPELQGDMDMPFDLDKMAYGGFTPLVELTK